MRDIRQTGTARAALALAILLCATASGCGQHISLRCVDAQTGQPIEGARTAIYSMVHDLVFGTRQASQELSPTDSQGTTEPIQVKKDFTYLASVTRRGYVAVALSALSPDSLKVVPEEGAWTTDQLGNPRVRYETAHRNSDGRFIIKLTRDLRHNDDVDPTALSLRVIAASSGKPLPGVQVTEISGPAGHTCPSGTAIAVGTTDGNGALVINSTLPGFNHCFRFERIGFEPLERTYVFVGRSAFALIECFAEPAEVRSMAAGLDVRLQKAPR
jgi:hypothetical protein